MLGEPLGELGVFAGPAMERVAELDGPRECQHGRFLRLTRLDEQACGLQRCRRLVGKGHDSRQISLAQTRAHDEDDASCLVAHHKRCGNHRAHVEQLAHAAGVRRDRGNGHGHSADQLVGVTDVVGPERGDDPAEDGSPIEGDGRADGGLSRHLFKVAVRFRKLAKYAAQSRTVGEQKGEHRESGFGQPPADDIEDRILLGAAECFESRLSQRSHQAFRRWVRGACFRNLARRHRRQKLGIPRLGQPFGAKEPHPANLLRREPAVSGLAPNDFRMPPDTSGDLLHREKLGQSHGEWHGRLCDATLHCSLQRRKVMLPTSYSRGCSPLRTDAGTPDHPGHG